MTTGNKIFQIDDVYCWIEQDSSVMIKAITAGGDPVELTSAEARRLGEILIKCSESIEKYDAQT